MAIPSKRILSRNLRLGLQQVYGQNPFDVMRNTNTSLEAITDKVKDARVSLGKVKNLINSLKGLQGKFDTSGLKNDFLDMLGINVFKRNLANLKAELTGLANDLGIRTRTSIDRLNGLPQPTKTQISAALYSEYGITAQGYDVTSQALTPVLNNPATTDNTTPATGTTTPSPVTSPTGTQCHLPLFAASTTVTSVLGISNTPAQTAVVVKPTPIPQVTPTVVLPQAVTVVDPIQVMVTIALIAAAIQQYGSLDNLPPELKPIIAEMLVAIGLDLSNEQVLLAGIQLGEIPVLVTLFPDLLDAALAIVTDIPALIQAMGNIATGTVFPVIKPTKPQLVQIQQVLPPMSSIDPVPLTTPAQIATVVATPIAEKHRTRYIRHNYMHQYYPALAL